MTTQRLTAAKAWGKKIKLYWNKRGRRKKYPCEGRVGRTIGARPQMTFVMTSVRSYAPEEIIVHESDISPQWLIDMLRSESANDLWNDKRAILCPRRNLTLAKDRQGVYLIKCFDKCQNQQINNAKETEKGLKWNTKNQKIVGSSRPPYMRLV